MALKMFRTERRLSPRTFEKISLLVILIIPVITRDMARDMAENMNAASLQAFATVCGDHCVSFQGPAFGGPFG